MDDLRKFEHLVSAWPHVSTHAHRFGGREFRFGRAEVGHIHRGGVVDIPFPRAVHDVLVADGLAEEHRWVPDSGWITFRIRRQEDLKHALWLMRLSYLRYALKGASDPGGLLRQESEELRLSPRLKSLLENFMPGKAKQAVTEPLPR
jgi:luciferase-like monooxygenase